MAMKHIACAAVPLLMAALPTQAVTVEQLNQQVQQMNKRIAEQDNKLRINGFASFGLVQSDNEGSYHRGITDEPNFRRYTKAGVQMTFNIDDSTSVITQLVSKGENDFDTRADWLYLKHSFGNGLTVKAGRLRKPNYLLSEFFDVGYAMPWTQPPVEVYGVLETSANYEAVDLTYDFEIGDWSAYTQVQYGRSITSEIVSKNLLAFNFSMNNGDLTLRAGYSQADAGIVSGSNTETLVTGINTAIASTNIAGDAASLGGTNKGTFFGLAAMYDNGQMVLISEYNSLTVDSVLADQDGYYLMGGYRIGQWMPYLTVAHEETTDDSDRVATSIPALSGSPATEAATLAGINTALTALNVEQDRTAIGVRYDWKPGVAIKVQYDMVDVGDTAGEFDPAPTEDTANILSITIDTVF
ncbi:MAG: hypothetical protein ACJA1U_001201 [Bermanella sp.]|jgi:hypothetical protein